MQRHVDPGPAPGNGMTWAEFHRQWESLHQELRERDERQQDILEEIRESLGAVHVRLETLPCDHHKTTMAQVAADLTSLRARTPDWEAVTKALPIFRPKVVMAILGGVATLAGWEWWEKAASAVDRWLQ